MPRFTRETAAIMAAKANASRWSPAARATREAQRLADLAESLKPPAIIPPPVPDDSFLLRRLNRVRIQLDLIDKAIEREGGKQCVDAQRLNWFCSAQERLAEQERVMAGRPLPGSRRPREDRGPRSGSWSVEAQPLGVALVGQAPQPPPAAATPVPASAAPCQTKDQVPDTGKVTPQEPPACGVQPPTGSGAVPIPPVPPV